MRLSATWGVRTEAQGAGALACVVGPGWGSRAAWPGSSLTQARACSHLLARHIVARQAHRAEAPIPQHTQQLVARANLGGGGGDEVREAVTASGGRQARSFALSQPPAHTRTPPPPHAATTPTARPGCVRWYWVLTTGWCQWPRCSWAWAAAPRICRRVGGGGGRGGTRQRRSFCRPHPPPLSSQVLRLSGVAGLVGGALSMAVGEYISGAHPPLPPPWPLLREGARSRPHPTPLPSPPPLPPHSRAAPSQQPARRGARGH